MPAARAQRGREVADIGGTGVREPGREGWWEWGDVEELAARALCGTAGAGPFRMTRWKGASDGVLGRVPWGWVVVRTGVGCAGWEEEAVLEYAGRLYSQGVWVEPSAAEVGAKRAALEGDWPVLAKVLGRSADGAGLDVLAREVAGAERSGAEVSIVLDDWSYTVRLNTEAVLLLVQSPDRLLPVLAAACPAGWADMGACRAVVHWLARERDGLIFGALADGQVTAIAPTALPLNLTLSRKDEPTSAPRTTGSGSGYVAGAMWRDGRWNPAQPSVPLGSWARPVSSCGAGPAAAIHAGRLHLLGSGAGYVTDFSYRQDTGEGAVGWLVGEVSQVPVPLTANTWYPYTNGLAPYRGVLHAVLSSYARPPVWCVYDEASHVWRRQALDGRGWGPSSWGAALAVYRDRLHCVWITDGSLRHAWYDGHKWIHKGEILAGTGAQYGASLAVYGDQLYCVFRGNGSDDRIQWAAYDGRVWTDAEEVAGMACAYAPSLALSADGGRDVLLLAAKGIQGPRAPVWTAAYDQATGWGPQEQLDITTCQAPSLIPCPSPSPDPQLILLVSDAQDTTT